MLKKMMFIATVGLLLAACGEQEQATPESPAAAPVAANAAKDNYPKDKKACLNQLKKEMGEGYVPEVGQAICNEGK